MMFDRRIARGPTNANKPIVKSGTESGNKKGKSITHGGKPSQNNNNDLVNPRKLPSVAEIHSSLKYRRKREELPLHRYLVEQKVEIAFTNESCQTDEFIEEPRPAPYIPMKTGVDAGTQVDTSMVFNYDRDVDPILEVLCGKTLEQSLMEVRQEEQFRALDKKKKGFLHNLDIEAKCIQNLENKEKKLYDASQEVLKKHRLKSREEKKVIEKNMATKCALDLLNGLEDAVFDKLSDTKEFVHPVERQIETEFLPW
eukprot:CAMPEP_0184493676 /NCGR_PEP_ID=MMETSP0113_2-20130426/26676_1 /TAXON_ID=91329 /ORGANISM="Norrisiella sphaerica, Strain BC52" /LENGTH=254 /DNA_ID=CAMNT_0026879027 /DNA_START=59 /DNA_END=820 /DNA_ORIENTATION=-